MTVERLAFRNFRNLAEDAIEPAPGVNVIYGENAQGKTNLLEAAWLFTGGHSFRGTKDAELPRLEDGKNAAEAALSMRIFSEGRAQELRLLIQNGRRSSTINGVEKKTGSALVGKFCAVIFSPEHLLLVKEGPARRRAFLDGALCQMKPSFARTLSHYTRALLQRNTLLKDAVRHPELLDTLEIWNERLVLFGVDVMLERIGFCRLLHPKAKDVYAGIAKGREALSLGYAPFDGADTKEALQAQFREALEAAEKTDIRAGFTSVGPHRDDLDIRIDGLSARTYGSQGQQRSIVLALKLAEADVLFGATGERPVILLDDVMSELDASRQDYLLNHIDGRQVFLTCCDPQAVRPMKEGKRFRVENGRIRETAVEKRE